MRCDTAVSPPEIAEHELALKCVRELGLREQQSTIFVEGFRDWLAANCLQAGVTSCMSLQEARSNVKCKRQAGAMWQETYWDAVCCDAGAA